MNKHAKSTEPNLNPSADLIPRVWGLHATAMKSYVVDNSVIPIGWEDIGALSEFVGSPDDDCKRDALTNRINETYEDNTKMKTVAACTQLWNFLNVAQVGDYVAYPYDVSGGEKCVYLGRITGDYFYEPSVRYRNQRKIEWVNKDEPILFNSLLADTRLSLSIPQTFFRISKDISARDLLHRFGIVPSDAVRIIYDTPPTVEKYIIDRLFMSCDGYQFQEFVADALRVDGYIAKVTGKGADGGVDIEATRDCPYMPVNFLVQCKRVSSDIGNEELQQLRGLLPEGTLGLFVTLSKFTNPARKFASDHKALILMNGHDFARFVLKVYKRMSAEHQKLLALDGMKFSPSAPTAP